MGPRQQFGAGDHQASAPGVRTTALPWCRPPEEFNHFWHRGGRSGQRCRKRLGIRSSAGFIVQHGKVVAEWGDTTKPTELASVRKSPLSALIGIAVSDHLINLDSALGELGIDANPPSLT